MKTPFDHHLTRRERQIMDVIYRAGRASVADVRRALPDPPGYSAVRALMNLLEEKGHLKHVEEGRKYVYVPTVARDKARRGALRKLVQTFFDGSVEQAMASLLDAHEKDLSDKDLARLSRMIEQARKEGR